MKLDLNQTAFNIVKEATSPKSDEQKEVKAEEKQVETQKEETKKD